MVEASDADDETLVGLARWLVATVPSGSRVGHLDRTTFAIVYAGARSRDLRWIEERLTSTRPVRLADVRLAVRQALSETPTDGLAVLRRLRVEPAAHSLAFPS